MLMLPESPHICTAERSLESGIDNGTQSLVLSLELARMTERTGQPLVRWWEGYITLQSFVALVLPYPSMYGSCSRRKSKCL